MIPKNPRVFKLFSGFSFAGFLHFYTTPHKIVENPSPYSWWFFDGFCTTLGLFPRNLCKTNRSDMNKNSYRSDFKN